MNALFNATLRKKNDICLTHSMEPTFPANPFPRKYVHCVFDDGHDATQAVLTLLAASYAAASMYILVGQDYLDTLEQRQTFPGSLISMDMEGYVREARRGHSILVIQPKCYEQIRQLRHLLMPHHAHLMRYIDTWTITELLA